MGKPTKLNECKFKHIATSDIASCVERRAHNATTMMTTTGVETDLRANEDFFVSNFVHIMALWHCCDAQLTCIRLAKHRALAAAPSARIGGGSSQGLVLVMICVSQVC